MARRTAEVIARDKMIERVERIRGLAYLICNQKGEPTFASLFQATEIILNEADAMHDELTAGVSRG